MFLFIPFWKKNWWEKRLKWHDQSWKNERTKSRNNVNTPTQQLVKFQGQPITHQARSRHNDLHVFVSPTVFGGWNFSKPSGTSFSGDHVWHRRFSLSCFPWPAFFWFRKINSTPIKLKWINWSHPQFQPRKSNNSTPKVVLHLPGRCPWNISYILYLVCVCVKRSLSATCLAPCALSLGYAHLKPKNWRKCRNKTGACEWHPSIKNNGWDEAIFPQSTETLNSSTQKHAAHRPRPKGGFVGRMFASRTYLGPRLAYVSRMWPQVGPMCVPC